MSDDPATQPLGDPLDPTDHRSGFVAILGRPNVGKSSFANLAVGTQLSAISSKPQTTWHQIRGILSEERGQMVFIDTPGLHRAASNMNQAMIANAVDAALDADAVLVLFDASNVRPFDWSLLETVQAKKQVLVGINKIDLVKPDEIQVLQAGLAERGIDDPIFFSCETGRGVDDVVTRLFALLPEGPPLYDPEAASDRSMRFIVAEYVRQAMFEKLKDELPYDVFVEVEVFEEDRSPINIEANIFVARKSQKLIVIGDKGRMLKKIGIRARQLIEELTGEQVYLRLWVKVLHKWNKREHSLRRAGVLMPGRQYKRAQATASDWEWGD